MDADAQFFASGSVTGWYDGGGLLATDNLNQGSGGFLYNPSAGAITTTIVGQVVQGSYTNHVTAGYNVYSLVPPVATNIDSAFSSFPGTSDSNAATNDTMYVWSGAGYNIAQYYTGADADIQFFQSGSVTGWFDGSGANVSTSPAYTPKVGQAFFIQHFGPTKTWTYSFQVQ